jgi:tetratricopeptide (TPR) repeat protein
MKKTALIAALIAIAAVQTAVYWNARLLDQAKEETMDPAGKEKILELAGRVYPWNDQVWFELGKTLFDKGTGSLGDPNVRDAALARSVRCFLEGLRLNPGSAAAHFELAQSLEYMRYLSLPAPVSYFDEFKKAASLTGHNSQIYGEVGKVLLARGESLGPEERDFTLGILRKMLAGKDQEKLRDLLEVWYLHGQDEAMIEKVLPEDSGCLRVYARFLGEKSLSLEAREKALAKAESLDFLKARSELDQSQRSFEYFQGDDAPARLSTCLGLLESISFYQALGREELIDPKEFTELRKTAYLLLAKSQVDKTRSLSDPDHFLATYLALEDQPLAVGEFEKFLAERGLPGKDESASRPRDLQALAFELTLDFKQNRYRDITKAGELVEKGAVIIPEAGRAHYARILRLVGDSYMKLDDIYEAEEYYLKALAVGPEDLDGLLRLERCYDRLNDDQKTAEVRRRINTLLSPAEIDLGRRALEKGVPIRLGLVCDGSPLTLTVTFENLRPGSRPLLAAFFNGRVVREDFFEGGTLSFPVTPAAGTNSLVLETVNEPVALIRVSQQARPAGG